MGDAEAPAAAEAAQEEKKEGAEEKKEGEDAEKKEGEDAEKKEGVDAEKEEKKEEKKEEEPKEICKMKEEKRVHRVSLQIESETPLPKPITSAQFKEIKKELDEYDAREKKIRDRAAAF